MEQDSYKKILLVEDDPKDVELTLEGLSGHNLVNEVQVLNDGAEALDYLLRRGRYDSRTPINPAFVLLDLKLPKVSGLEILKELRGNEATKHLPVVVLTSSREEGDVLQSYRFGVNAYVVKPVSFSAFLDAVREIGLFWALLNEPPPGSAFPRT